MSSGFTSPYSPNTDLDRRKMLDAIGVESVDDLFEDIPPEHRDPRLDLPGPLSEFELRGELEAMAGENRAPGQYACFLGAGLVQALHPRSGPPDREPKRVHDGLHALPAGSLPGDPPGPL